MPKIEIPKTPNLETVKPKVKVENNSITINEYTNHVELSLSQLETVALMLQILDQADGGKAPTG
jgi:hypothetical protein